MPAGIRASFRRVLALAATASLAFAGAAVVALTAPASADDGGVINLKAGQTVVITSTRPMTTTGDAGILVPLQGTPSGCRSNPAVRAGCDAYRIKLDLDPREGAINFLRVELDFDTPTAPPLVAVVAGIVAVPAGDLNLNFFDLTGTKFPVDGAGAPYMIPEVAAFQPKLAEFDLTVQSNRAPVIGYVLTFQFSNELFDSPFEVLDPALAGGGGDFAAPVDRSGDEPAIVAPAASIATSPLTEGGFGGSTDVINLRPVGSDQDFTGFRGAVDNQLTGDLAGFQQRDLTRLVTADAPPVFLVILWLVLVPLALLALAAAWLRRRRPEALVAT